MVWPAVTLLIENVMVDKSEEMVQNNKIAAELTAVAVDWQSPINEKSIKEVPVVFIIASSEL